MAVAANMVVKLKKSAGNDAHAAYGERWKVTARYRLDMGDGIFIACVRVRQGVGPVHHFTLARFNELFTEVKR